MWIFTTSGFLAVVAHHDRPGDLLVRARVLDDLSAFCAATGAPAPIETPSRVKNAVAQRQGADRAHRYHDVWDTMHELQLDGMRMDRATAEPDR